MMSFGGWGLDTSVRVRMNFVDGVVQVVYQRAPDILMKVPSLSDKQARGKNELRSEASTRRGYLWAWQLPLSHFIHENSSPTLGVHVQCKRNVLEHSSAQPPYLHYRHLD